MAIVRKYDRVSLQENIACDAVGAEAPNEQRGKGRVGSTRAAYAALACFGLLFLVYSMQAQEAVMLAALGVLETRYGGRRRLA